VLKFNTNNVPFNLQILAARMQEISQVVNEQLKNPLCSMKRCDEIVLGQQFTESVFSVTLPSGNFKMGFKLDTHLDNIHSSSIAK
jgi:hypothetical protein